jgi:hypothetical protein
MRDLLTEAFAAVRSPRAYLTVTDMRARVRATAAALPSSSRLGTSKAGTQTPAAAAAPFTLPAQEARTLDLPEVF